MLPATQLDIVIPSFNRRDLLERTIVSILSANIPAGLSYTIYAVDNRCTDGSDAMIRRYERSHPDRVQYVREDSPGSSAARNAGAACSSGDIVAFVDDDEEVFPNWLDVIAREFCDLSLDFIGGPVVPRCVRALPPWVPDEFPSVIGAVNGPVTRTAYGPSFDGILMGGNAAVRRSVLEKAGPFNTSLGRDGGAGLMTGEDREFYERLLAIRARGQWVPEFKVYHFLPSERLTKKYHRRWVFDHGVSMARLAALRNGSPPRVPRWRYGAMLREPVLALNVLAPPQSRFRSELLFLESLGFVIGAYRSARFIRRRPLG